jgi:hypothetical protein
MLTSQLTFVRLEHDEKTEETTISIVDSIQACEHRSKFYSILK